MNAGVSLSLSLSLSLSISLSLSLSLTLSRSLSRALSLVCSLPLCLSFCRAWAQVFPGSRRLLQDAFRSGSKSALLLVLFALIILAYMGHNHFGSVVLPGMHRCLSTHTYFSSLPGSFFVAWLMMSSEDMLPKMVAGYVQAGPGFVVFVVVGGILLRFVVMKACFAALMDNFEMDNWEKIQHQLRSRDMQERTEAHHKRKAFVKDTLRCASRFDFSDFQYCKNAGGPQGVVKLAGADQDPILTSCAFAAAHLSDQVGHRVHLELSAEGVICIYRASSVPPFLQSALPSLFSHSHVLEQEIPVCGSHLLAQSPLRAQHVTQRSPFALCIRPDWKNESLRLFQELFVETLVFFPSRRVLEEWMDKLMELGADGAERGAVLAASRSMEETPWWKSESGHHLGAAAALSAFSFEREVRAIARGRAAPIPKRNGSIECLQAPSKLMSKATFKLFDKLAEALGYHGDLKRSKPKHTLLRTVFKSKSYEVFSLSIVVICVVLTVLDPPITEALIPLTSREAFGLQLLFAACFSLEWCFKCLAHGLQDTFSDKWENTHLLVTLGMIAELVVCNPLHPSTQTSTHMYTHKPYARALSHTHSTQHTAHSTRTHIRTRTHKGKPVPVMGQRDRKKSTHTHSLSHTHTTHTTHTHTHQVTYMHQYMHT
jgi:hypothetical protein